MEELQRALLLPPCVSEGAEGLIYQPTCEEKTELLKDIYFNHCDQGEQWHFGLCGSFHVGVSECFGISNLKQKPHELTFMSGMEGCVLQVSDDMSSSDLPPDEG